MFLNILFSFVMNLFADEFRAQPPANTKLFENFFKKIL